METGVVLTGISGHLLRQQVRPRPELAFYGESITQVGFGRQGVIQTGNGGSAFRRPVSGVVGALVHDEAAAPHARILALRPFNGTHADDIAAVVAELADPRTEFVDTTDWLSLSGGDFNGTVHPSAPGHRKVADRLFALIAKEHQ